MRTPELTCSEKMGILSQSILMSFLLTNDTENVDITVQLAWYMDRMKTFLGNRFSYETQFIWQRENYSTPLPYIYVDVANSTVCKTTSLDERMGRKSNILKNVETWINNLRVLTSELQFVHMHDKMADRDTTSLWLKKCLPRYKRSSRCWYEEYNNVCVNKEDHTSRTGGNRTWAS